MRELIFYMSGLSEEVRNEFRSGCSLCLKQTVMLEFKKLFINWITNKVLLRAPFQGDPDIIIMHRIIKKMRE